MKNAPIFAMLLIMIVEQIIEVPPSRRITLDLPQDLPVGKVRVSIFPVPPEKSKADIALLSMRNTSQREEALKPLASFFGADKELDTMDAYFERKRADKAKEDALYELSRKTK